jgi:hypothetical protein
MKLRFIIISIILFWNWQLIAQYQNQTIVMKLTDSNQLLELNQNTKLNTLLHNIEGSIHQIFPNHKTPTEITNEYGQRLVDLSLWLQLEYKNNLPESFVISMLRATALFEYVEQRPLNTLFYVPNDSLLGHQWYLNNIHAFSAWDIEQGDTNVVVGVTDTGIDRVGEDLKNGIKYNYQDPVDGIDNDNDGFIDNFCGWDVGSNDNNVQWGPIGHGTFVAGFVSAVPDNGKGIAGVGFHIKTLPVKIDDTDGKLIHDYEGIAYAADHGASIINCAWGGPIFTQFGKDVIDYATFNRNALVVAACGNSNNAVWMYPASYENVLSVAATDSLDVRWTQSSYGSQVDLCAPGTFVYSTWVNNIYFSSHGTSFSAPMVAAAAALVKSHFPWMNALQLGEQMRVSTDYIDSIVGNIPTKDLMGSGRLNMLKALTDTTSPSIRFSDKVLSFSSKNNLDTIIIKGKFTNYLSPSSAALKAVISCSSPYIQILDSVVNLGALGIMGTTTNYSNPFRITTLANIPLGYQADIKIHYSDGNYSAFEFFRLELNKDYLNIDTNKIDLTLTSTGRIGFNDDNLNQGIGLIYKGGRSMMTMGGLLVATSSNRVSDQIYSDQGYDHDFRALIPITEGNNPKNSDQSFFCEFDDDNAGFGKQNITIKQYSYAYNQSSKEKFVILEYHIINNGGSSLTGLYAALYADFDIEKSTTNKANYNALHQLAYTYQAAGGKLAGIMLLEGKNANAYCIDNDGSNGSISIYDGFYDFEKYQTMTQPRDSAGYGAGGDVSNMLSSGPYSIAAGDSIVVSFAVLAGDHLPDLKQVAQEAYDTYYNTASTDLIKKEPTLFLYSAQPNPFTSQTRITILNTKNQDIELSFYNSNGRLIKEWSKFNLPAGSFHYTFNADKLKLSPGTYYIVLSSATEHYSRKLILVK